MTYVSDYLAKQPDDRRAIFDGIRQLVHEAAPNIEETVSYGLPAFKYHGKYVLGFYAYKDHLSIFPTPGPIEAFKDQLKGYKTSKGTIQFTEDHQLPTALLRDIIAFQIAYTNP